MSVHAPSLSGSTRILGPRGRRRPCSRLHLEKLEDRCLLSADVVIEWNSLVLDAARATSADPLVLTRGLAMVHGAIYDAVNNIEQTNTPYLVDHPVSPDTSEEAAAATAGYRVAVQVFPSQRDTLHAAWRADLAAIENGPAKRQGIALGNYVANVMLDWRSHDGSDLVVEYPGGTEPGQWRPTPPAYAPALKPQWPGVTPFTLTSGAQFRAYPPPTLASVEYRAAFDEIRSVGAVDSTTRTADQTETSLFWEDPAGRTSTPPGHWNHIAQTVAQAQGNTMPQNARLFALLDLTLADAGIAFMDTKYAYGFWRAVTAIRETADPDWLPLITTPPHPSYLCAHCSVSTSAAEVLTSFFATDDISFSSTAEGIGVTRSYSSFSQASDEAGLSRLYGGIHWRFDINAGNGLGRALGRYVTGNFLLPLGGAPGPGGLGTKDWSLVVHPAPVSPDAVFAAGPQVTGNGSVATAAMPGDAAERQALSPPGTPRRENSQAIRTVVPADTYRGWNGRSAQPVLGQEIDMFFGALESGASVASVPC
ncbi:MAG TPA: vanadium-dependent haloperoxidase [Gemmataceae bacterium]|nr:vanadium-dependent haloperoxidase [Gemmataceae bacterium]